MDARSVVLDVLMDYRFVFAANDHYDVVYRCVSIDINIF